MRIFTKKEGRVYSIPVKEIRTERIKSVSSVLARKILDALAKKPMYPRAISRKLRVNEQKIYYHIRQLERNGIIRKIRQKVEKGIVMNYFALAEKAFFVRFGEFEETKKIDVINTAPAVLSPFIDRGKINAFIVIGSPEPHGPSKARSRDGMYAVDLALFLGSFLYHKPFSSVKMDIDMTKDDLRQNLIVIGGPKVNKITSKMNKYMPLFFDSKKEWAVVSKATGKTYSSNDCGVIVKMRNPFARDKKVLVIAGKRFSGTKAAILALTSYCDKLSMESKKGKTNLAKVAEGVDLDFDGIVDYAEFLE